MPISRRLPGIRLDQLPHGLPRAVAGLALAVALCAALRLLPGAAGSFFLAADLLLAVALLLVGTPLVWRLLRQRLLWSLRNKLVLTYLLIGLAPVVLFVTLVLISAYIAAGQFSIHLVETRLQAELDRIAVKNGGLMMRLLESAGRAGGVNVSSDTLALPPASAAARDGSPRESRVIFLDGQALNPPTGEAAPQRSLGLPPWASHLPRHTFQGLVLDGGRLFLVDVLQSRLPNGQRLSVLRALPIDERLMAELAQGIGRAGVVALMTGGDSFGPGANPETTRSTGSLRQATPARAGDQLTRDIRQSSTVFGGVDPPGVNVLDLRVRFQSTLPIVNWDTGEPDNIPVEVDSRPSLLYRQLFGGSISGITTRVIRIGLLLLCVVFALIEIVALSMALRLSRTITASVSDLYQGTLSVDRGDFSHRIGVTRGDQLAELSRSFNRMTGSLQRLLAEQKQAERLQNELSIAQEVQANLFPRANCDLPTLELHGVCRPARSVSGDYYDFISFHEGAHEGVVSGREIGVGIAIGDISGKGISAALLMATLHSAVRAYRFASEERIEHEGTNPYGAPAVRDGLFESPGRILAMLNRHLYRSTQPEKYATLFLASYEAATGRLTYSNAGQLPPLLLRGDGSVDRLDCGGTVVGLLDGMHYDEGTLTLAAGDLLVAYSDGVTEPENDFGDFGEDRLLEVVERYRSEPLHVISAQVMHALDAWIGAEEQPDDITLVLARQV